MANRIQLRRGTADNWTAVNPTLSQGEPALETDTGRRKLGDGTTAWTALGYQFDQTIADAIYALNSGNTVIGMGDSITYGQALLSDGTSGGFSYLPYMHLASNGRIRILRNSGIGGNSSAAMLSRFTTDVTAYSPRKVIILCGTNDALGATKANLVSMIAQARAGGSEPILATIPPIGTAAISAPATLTLASANTGGTLAPGTYGYRVTAVNGVGETLASTEQTIVVPAGTTTNVVNLGWSGVLGATQYKVYGRTPGGELFIATLANTYTDMTPPTGYTDTGSITPSGALPSSNTTAVTTPAAVPGGKAKVDYVNSTVTYLAEQYGLSLIDFYSVLVDPLTGMYQTGLTWDGIHPTPKGARLMGAAAASALAERFQAGGPRLTGDNAETSNLISGGGLFTGSVTSPPQGNGPGGWSVFGGTSNAYTISVATDAAVLGKAYNITSTDTSQHFSGAPNIVAFSVGDVVEFTGRIKTSGLDAGGGTFYLRASFTGSTGTDALPSRIKQINISTDIPWSTFSFRAVVPPNTTAIYLERFTQFGSFSASIAQLAIRNLTALRVLA